MKWFKLAQNRVEWWAFMDVPVDSQVSQFLDQLSRQIINHFVKCSFLISWLVSHPN
jgi:hypothetical protein